MSFCILYLLYRNPYLIHFLQADTHHPCSLLDGRVLVHNRLDKFEANRMTLDRYSSNSAPDRWARSSCPASVMLSLCCCTSVRIRTRSCSLRIFSFVSTLASHSAMVASIPMCLASLALPLAISASSLAFSLAMSASPLADSAWTLAGFVRSLTSYSRAWATASASPLATSCVAELRVSAE